MEHGARVGADLVEDVVREASLNEAVRSCAGVVALTLGCEKTRVQYVCKCLSGEVVRGGSGPVVLRTEARATGDSQ